MIETGVIYLMNGWRKRRIYRIISFALLVAFFSMNVIVDFSSGSIFIQSGSKAFAEGSDGSNNSGSSVDFENHQGPELKNVEALSDHNSITVTGTGISKDGMANLLYQFSIENIHSGTTSSEWISGATEIESTSVVDEAYETGGTGGRKLVQLENGWLVAGVLDRSSNQIKFFKSEDNGLSWSQLCYIYRDHGNIKDFALASYENTLYVINDNGDKTFNTDAAIEFRSIDVIQQENVDIFSQYTLIDHSQIAIGTGYSLAVDSNGVIHAVWVSKNNRYTDSFNIRYSKSTNGGVTWETPTQISKVNSYVWHHTTPCLVIDKYNKPVIIDILYSLSSSYYYVESYYMNGSNWYCDYLYFDSQYSSSQTNPCAVVDSDGVIHVVWEEMPIANNTKCNIRYAKSVNGGVQWTDNRRLTSDNTSKHTHPTITVTEGNDFHVLWQSASSSQYELQKMSCIDGSWRDVETVESTSVASAFYPQSCIAQFNSLVPMYIYRGEQSNSIKFMGIIVQPVSYTFSNLTPNTQYDIKFEAKDAAGNISEWTKSIYTKAEVPFLSTSHTGVTSLDFVISDNNPDDTQYQIQCGSKYVNSYGELVTEPTWITLESKSLTIKGLKSSYTYIFQAKARNNESIESTLSNKVQITTLNTLAGVPANITAETSNTSTGAIVTLTWNPIGEAAGYEIEISDNTTTSAIISTTEPYFIHGESVPLPYGTLFKYRVRAKSASGDGPWSKYIYVTTPVRLPETPVNLTANAASTSVTVTWSPVNGAATYELEVDGVVVNLGTNTAYLHKGLELGTSHSYRVRAKNSAGVSSWSPVVTVITTYTIPGVPVNISYQSTDTTIVLAWTQVPDAQGYEVETDGVITDNGTSISCRKTGLLPSSSHTFRVRARNAAGYGAWSEPLEITTYQLQTPDDFTALEDDTSVILSWGDVIDAESYQLDIDGVVMDVGLTTGYIHTDLTPETQHVYKVRAVSAIGTSAWSEKLYVYTLPNLPEVPMNISAMASNQSITLIWDAVPDAVGYDIELDGIVVENDNITTYVHNNLQPNTRHTYRVRARNEAIEGEWSSPITITTLPEDPMAPRDITITASGTTVKISWSPVVGAIGYDIEVDGVVVNNGTRTAYSHFRVAPGTEHTYRVRTRSVLGESTWCGFIVNNTIKARCTRDKDLDLGLTASDITDFSRYTLTVTYKADVLEVIDLSLLSPGIQITEGVIDGTGITITRFTPGQITFVVDKPIEEGLSWTGVINSIRFRAKATGGTTITYTVVELPQDEA